MPTSRLEAFSDGVLAIIITIMVLELKVPEGTDLEHLRPALPTFITYVLSFIYLGIFWNNHHHLMHSTSKVNGQILWANLHLLFWLSLLPFATGYMGQNHFTPTPTALYGFVLLMSGVSWQLLHRAIKAYEDKHHLVHRVYANKRKNWASMILYSLSIVLSFVSPIMACTLFVLVAILWIIPDRAAEQELAKEH